MKLLAFDDVIGRCAPNRPHVLLGNGFSIACRPDIFQYERLLDHADFSDAIGDIPGLFEALHTSDFEKIIEHLVSAAKIVDAYAGRGISADDLRADADVVKNALTAALAASHPDLPFAIKDDEYTAARDFLANFERIYSLNYDMLLYWTLMQTELEPWVERNDGFGEPSDPGTDYVAWQPYDSFRSQRVFFIHGGLHLYDRGPELSKITYSRTTVPLLDQIRGALDEGRYPLLVTEGTSTEKHDKILHSAYLSHALRSFNQVTKPLVVYGLSFSANDDHIIDVIVKGTKQQIYVSIYGDPDSPENTAIMRRATEMVSARQLIRQPRPLSVEFFDADSASVWS